MKPKVYLETTIISYLTSRPSRDLIVAAHQQITLEWWESALSRFDLSVSEFVLDEIRAGDVTIAEKRLALIQNFPVLTLNDDVAQLIGQYDKLLGLAGKAKVDIPHFAFSVAHRMDFMVTWNCSHIANGEIVRRLMKINTNLGLDTPLIVTPEELLEVKGD